MKKLYLIDGNAYMHRAFHALPPLTTSRGEMVNAVYGFIRMLLKIVRTEAPAHIAVCFDYPAKTFRHAAYPAYKAQRKAMDDALRNQMPLAREAVRVLGIPCLEREGYEADDLIATLARAAAKDGAACCIVSADKDVLQLVTAAVSVWNEARDVRYGPAEVREKYGLPPERLTDMFALMGDASDNVPGIKGIGEKTAVKLLRQFGDLQAVLNRCEELTGRVRELVCQGKDAALQSKALVTLNDQVPIPVSWEACVPGPRDEAAVIAFLNRLEFFSLVREFLPAAAGPAVGSEALPEIQQIADAQGLSALVTRLSAAGTVFLASVPERLDLLVTDTEHECWHIPAALVPALLHPLADQTAVELVGHDLKPLVRQLQESGQPLRARCFDTMLASYCLNPSRAGHALADLSLEYLGLQLREEVLQPGTDGRHQGTEDGAMAACRLRAVIRLAAVLREKLAAAGLAQLYYDIELPVMPVLAGMESCGFTLDCAYLEKLSVAFAEAMAGGERDMYALAGRAFNPNSPKQLSALLFDTLHLPVIRRTKTGYSTDEEVLRQLAGQHPLPLKIIEYRELQKLKSTYIDGLLAAVDRTTGRVHTTFNQAVTATGRLSSSDPNLQNIPVRSEYGRQIRRAFIAPAGSVLVSGDYSQIDLRVLAHVSGDTVLVRSFIAGEDIHAATAREVFRCPPELPVPADVRRMAKAINFGIVYGISPYGLAQQLKIPSEEAGAYIKQYFEKYPGVAAWIAAIVQEARTRGSVTTLFGRRRYLPEINAKNAQMRAFAERTAMNTPIQGTAADIIKIAMITIDRALRAHGFTARLLVQVHDELVFEAPREEAGALAPFIRQHMEQAAHLRVPLVVDMKAGPHWAALQPLVLARGKEGTHA